jgi:hypothetical protein
MAKKVREQQYIALKSMFDSNNVKRMKDLEKLYPTLVANDLRMNHGRYIKKLYNPEDFTIKQIFKLASIINVNPGTIANIIVTEVASKYKVRDKR